MGIQCIQQSIFEPPVPVDGTPTFFFRAYESDGVWGAGRWRSGNQFCAFSIRHDYMIVFPGKEAVSSKVTSQLGGAFHKPRLNIHLQGIEK